METKVTPVNGRWVLQFKTPSMTAPAFWHYDTEQEATAAEKRMNPSIHSRKSCQSFAGLKPNAYCA